MIPKIIHQIWIGDKPQPTRLTETWRMFGYEYVLWDEKKIDNLKMVNEDKYNRFYKEKKFYGAADIARVEILYQYGGIYVDADFERLQDFPKKWHNYDFLCYSPKNKNDFNFRVGNSLFGAKKESEIILEYRNRISLTKKINPAWIQIGGSLLTKVLLDFIDNDSFKILLLPPETFYTLNIKGKIHGLDKIDNFKVDDAYARHYMASKNSKIYKNKS